MRLIARRLGLAGALCGAVACGESEPGGAGPGAGPAPADEVVCVGKCDGVDAPAVSDRYTFDLDAANAIWPAETPAEKASDFFTVTISLPNGHRIRAATHMFGEPVNPIPYHDEDGEHVVDAAGTKIVQGDRELARFFPPGSIGYAIKHHRPERRTLDFAALGAGGATASALKEDMKLQDTHIELVVGVRRPLGSGGEKVDGVVTLNNPQGYQGGRFGDAKYGMVFVKPRFPDYLPAGLHGAFIDNIRTMMLGFNAVSSFPGDYNGGDPLAASRPEKVREHVRQMVLAIADDGPAGAEARAWFTRQENMIYCAELAHVATSAGLLVPLNRKGLVESGLVDEATYERFARLVADHQAGLSTPFTQLNRNKFARYVDAAMAPDDLEPLPAYGGAEEAAKLAFRPQTMAEIVEGFLATHIPRRDPRLGGEALAPVQAAVLQAMKPGLYEAMGMDDGLYRSMIARAEERIASLREDLADPALSDARRVSVEQDIESQERQLAEARAQLEAVRRKRAIVEQVFAEVLAIVGTQYESYAAFREALAPAIAKARQLAGPRADGEVGYFVPPSALHLVALGCPEDDRCGGLIGLDYVGHGIHLSAVRVNAPPPAPEPVAVVGIAELVPRPGQDYNEDGAADPRRDEYVHVVNDGAAPADLTGWRLEDPVGLRFEFPDGFTLAAGEGVFVYGGGAVEHAARGGLGLNDNGDTLTLFDADGQVVEQVTWGRVARDEVVRGALARW